MKFNSKKVAALALAATMCMPMSAMAAQTGATTTSETNGNFTTSFDIYSPTLHVSVPVRLDVQVNPFNDSTVKTVDKFQVASGSIDIINASVDKDKDIGIPVNVAVTATVTSQEDVQTEFTQPAQTSTTSTKKRIYLELAEANVSAAATPKTGETPAFLTGDNDKLLDLSKYELSDAEYDAVTNKAPITSYGSLLSVDIAKPALDTGKTSYVTTAADVKPTVGSFAVTGMANTHADWQKDDVAVAVSYKITASNTLGITTPTVTVAGNVAANADVTFDIPAASIGESTVAGIAYHDPEGRYADYLCEEEEYTAVADATGKVTVTLKKEGAGLAFVTGADSGCKGSRQDLVVALSDGRRLVVSLQIAQ